MLRYATNVAKIFLNDIFFQYYMDVDDFHKEMEHCLNMWDTRGSCALGGGTRCEDCGAPYLLLKFITGEIIHGDVKRLSLAEWKEKFGSFYDVLPGQE